MGDVDRAALAALRARTVAGLADCVRALREVAGDVAMAVEVLARYERERAARTHENRAAIERQITALSSDRHDLVISDCVAMGFYTVPEIIEIVAGQFDRLDRGSVAASVNAEVERKRLAIEEWPELTVCDELDRSLGALLRRNIVVVQNAGVTGSDGLECAVELVSNNSIGYCYYTLQDLTLAVHGQGLWLAFGAMHGGEILDDNQPNEAVGQLICDMLDGISEVSWSGRSADRIALLTLPWQRRGPEVGVLLPADAGIYPRYFAH